MKKAELSTGISMNMDGDIKTLCLKILREVTPVNEIRLPP